MKAKHQRLTLALVALAAITGAGLLAASALQDEAAYFYAPATPMTVTHSSIDPS